MSSFRQELELRMRWRTSSRWRASLKRRKKLLVIRPFLRDPVLKM